MSYKNLEPFFKPKSIAVIGASRSPEKVGYQLVKSLIDVGYEGKIYPVNPKADEILELKAYPNIKSISETVDLALIAIPAQGVPEVLREAGECKVKCVIVISGGFKEVGGEGVKLEEEVKRIAKEYGIRLMGPNCIGVYDPHNKIDTLFLPRGRALRPKRGEIAFISQSGAMGVALLDWMTMEDIGLSCFVSYGNKADVDEIDLLEYLLHDEKCKVIAMYIEEITNGRRFIEVASETSKVKPIVAIKAGRTMEGAKAVSSHTGALAGREEIVEAAFKKAGVIRAYDTHELFDYARALATGRVAFGDRIAIVTDGGGAGVMATDKLTDEKRGVGLKLTELKEETIIELKKHIPPFAIPHNPIDLTGSVTPEMYGDVIEIVARDENVDGIIVIVLIHPPAMNVKVVDEVEKAYKSTNKPILVASTGGEPTQRILRMFQEGGIPSYPEVERAVKAMKCLVERGRYLKKLGEGIH